MIASAIREFAVSKNPQLLAAAYFEKTIQFWNPLTQEKISEIPTIYSFGARNLALSHDAQILVVGRSTTSGKIAAYDVPTGEKLWEQKLIYPSYPRFNPSGGSILCSVRATSTVRIDSKTGAILERIRGIKNRVEGIYGDTLEYSSREDGLIRLKSRDRTFSISKGSFALLDATFSPNSVCLTEASGPVRCFCSSGGKLNWIFDPGKNQHVLRVHFSPRSEAFFGTLRNSTTARRYLLRFDPSTGARQELCELNSWEDAFLEDTDQLVTSAGDIVDLASGEITGKLAFPQTEYPDS